MYGPSRLLASLSRGDRERCVVVFPLVPECEPDAPSECRQRECRRRRRKEVLLVFFSRAGENYFNGGRKVLTVGNTEVVADFIRDALG